MAIRGSCLCGGVTFEIDRAAGPFEICHCNRCRKVSGGAALATIGVRTESYRFLAGRELVRSFAAPILYGPPAYRSLFCARCGSPVPEPEPEGDTLEIPAGLLDDDPQIKPDKHIFVELAAPWDDLRDDLPRLTVRELVRLRTGEELPEDFTLRTHGSSGRPQRPGGRR
ncbi:MAG: GFA family protein [Thermodesulfobacteriota bacterium]